MKRGKRVEEEWKSTTERGVKSLPDGAVGNGRGCGVKAAEGNTTSLDMKADIFTRHKATAARVTEPPGELVEQLLSSLAKRCPRNVHLEVVKEGLFHVEWVCA
ncbi:hypothetical protein EYF80_019191 [Liparis tanakae]|uniref:Uncharacterized protein n=1 Tax=Liparis tanakae TaxID=230148 RepID=A0A4Z2HY34_9TELE|nr:hypothetical protein EYF80_019191 [Liparis tanakae]